MSTVENTRYARVFHRRQWSNYNIPMNLSIRTSDQSPSSRNDVPKCHTTTTHFSNDINTIIEMWINLLTGGLI